MTSAVAVVTTVTGRHDHLLNQRHALANGACLPDQHVVVSMGDPEIGPLLADEPACRVVEIDASAPLPIAKSRNVGAEVAISGGARTLIFLDADCIPSKALVGRYAALAGTPDHERSILCGQVSYAPSGVRYAGDVELLAAGSAPHPARPRLEVGQVLPTVDYSLFWSLSFAVSSNSWGELGGFCESYVGYGGEDTDFGECARRAGLTMLWVGGADAYHQYHPVSDPPVEHLDEILANARVFEARWGWWPMQGWLRDFESAGLISYNRCARRWTRMPG